MTTGVYNRALIHLTPRKAVVTDQPQQQQPSSQSNEDSKADAQVIVVIFVTALLMALHFVSGFTFDF